MFSHEKNPEEALRILNTIMSQHKAPDYYLLKAEIAEFMGKSAEKEQNIQAFVKAIEDENYGVMYTAYIITVLDEELNATKKRWKWRNKKWNCVLRHKRMIY